MIRLTLLVLVAVFGVQAQFLSLPVGLQNLVPQDIQNVLSGLSEKQVKLLQEVEKEHKLGVKLVNAVDTLGKKLKQLPAAASGDRVKNYYLLLANINESNKKGQLGKLINGYEALSAADRAQLKKLFPDVVATLESPELHRLAGYNLNE